MSLSDDLELAGYRTRHEGNGNYRVIGYGGLIVKDNFWFQHSTHKGGSIHSISDVLGKDINIKAAPSPRSSPLKRDEELLDPSDYVIDYLKNERSIDIDLISSLISRSQIKQDRHRRACFLGYDQNGKLRCVTKRATDPTHRIVKMEAPGSDKNYSFSIASKHQNSDLVITESPIDALSVAVMEHRYHQKGYFETHKISTCGAPLPGLKYRIRRINPRRIWLFYDNDDAGRQMDQITRRIISNDFPCYTIPYEQGKDPNEMMIFRKSRDHNLRQ